MQTVDRKLAYGLAVCDQVSHGMCTAARETAQVQYVSQPHVECFGKGLVGQVEVSLPLSEVVVQKA